MGSPGIDIAILLIAAGLGLALLRLSQALWTVEADDPNIVRVRGQYSPLVTWLRYRRLPRLVRRPIAWAPVAAHAAPLAEVGALALWATWFGQSYFDLNPQFVPWGTEFAMSIQSHYIWTLLGRCGACIFWNGFTNGGAPALVDLHGAPLHPLIILTTLVWGPTNGAKLTVVACLFLAGLAQWWLARVLRLGWVARLWVAALAVVAGNVAGRLEFGLVPLALSMAMSALVIAASVELALTGRRRAAIGLGVLAGLWLLAGQGYLQVGVAISVLPALAILLVGRRLRLAPVWKEFALAGALAVLLSAVLWVPLAHFWPNLAKDTDPSFQSAQSLAATPLNLIINDPNFYYDTRLGKQPYPYLYLNYTGWVPVLLALAALPLIPRARWRLSAFFLAAIGLVFLASSAVTLRALAVALPDLAASVRNPSLMAGLAVPLILALAGWGLDLLLKRNWPKLRVRIPVRPGAPAVFNVSTAWLALALPLAWSLQSAYDFDQGWLLLYKLPASQPQVIAALKGLAPAGQAEWLQPPIDENLWLTAAMEAGLKIAYYYRPWQWNGRDFPLPFAEGLRANGGSADPAFRETLAGVDLLRHPDRPYAAVVTSAGMAPCRATAVGGDIDVTCAAAQPGQLVVQEHSWTGWWVQLDGHPAALASGQWLATPAPAGQHTFTFRYRPWDVPLGAAISLVGLVLAGLAWALSTISSNLSPRLRGVVKVSR